jgi:hypothetical protein
MVNSDVEFMSRLTFGQNETMKRDKEEQSINMAALSVFTILFLRNYDINPL